MTTATDDYPVKCYVGHLMRSLWIDCPARYLEYLWEIVPNLVTIRRYTKLVRDLS